MLEASARFGKCRAMVTQASQIEGGQTAGNHEHTGLAGPPSAFLRRASSVCRVTTLSNRRAAEQNRPHGICGGRAPLCFGVAARVHGVFQCLVLQHETQIRDMSECHRSMRACAHLVRVPSRVSHRDGGRRYKDLLGGGSSLWQGLRRAPQRIPLAGQVVVACVERMLGDVSCRASPAV